MKKIAVEQIENDMILLRNVTGTSGNTLLGSGTKLSTTMGRRLKNWGIVFVYIEGEEAIKETDNKKDISPEDIEKKLSEKFSDVISDPIMKQIFTAVYNFKTNKTT